jgi:hypothetical protein
MGVTIVGKKKLSHDQKRKLKLKKKAERSNKHESMAYYGHKYKAAEYVPIIHRTEIGIYESYVISDGSLTDDDVESGIEQLIGQIRAATLPRLSEHSQAATSDQTEETQEEELLIWNIRRNWQIFAEVNSLPARDDLIGVLRTILSSVETRRSMALHPQGYLRFLEGFMKETGVRVAKVAPDRLPRGLVEEVRQRSLTQPWSDHDLENDHEAEDDSIK